MPTKTGRFVPKPNAATRSKTVKVTARQALPEHAVVVKNGRKYVLVPAAEYNRMTRLASPATTSRAGSVDALAFADETIARSIVRDRNAVGLTQQELARRAGIRVEVLNRAERGVVVPSIRTLTKIENALIAAGLRRPSR